ncbi:VanZ family protein [Thauera sinica]|uniref:VanZ family protein n=1 Tax=Thauera sinica TaxID=2665146 RepID=A0ABW1ANQ1_9RHOO|nr:hypothetical protein [Thauera sp. K11]
MPDASMPAASRAWRWALFLGCGAALAYGLFRPEPPPQLYAGAAVESDKLLHVVAFAAFCVSARVALTRVGGVWLWGALLALAPLTEWLQHFLQPARTFSLADIQANVAGVALAFVLAAACERMGWGARLLARRG